MLLPLAACADEAIPATSVDAVRPSEGCEVTPAVIAPGEAVVVSGTRLGRKQDLSVRIAIADQVTTHHARTNGGGAFSLETVAPDAGAGVGQVIVSDRASGAELTTCAFEVQGCQICAPDDCGTIDDGCGGTLDCGDCAPACTPNACAPDDRGTIDDGCGGTLDCGDCAPTCAPNTCAPDDCGTIDDGCGGTLDCGDCAPACTPNACAPDDCGTIDDGCGGTLDCGECPPPVPGTPPEQPPADQTVDGPGRFRIGCDFSHQLQVDPIVAPFASSHHMHDFFGNTITSSDPSYERMITGGTSCGFSQDTAAYWFPALQAPDGSFVQPDRFQFYYRARPENYEHGTNVFPPDFKMIAGGAQAPDTAAYWTCKGESDTGYADRKTYVPDCTGVEEQLLVAHVFFPSCWDGVHLDSPDHRSHVTYGVEDDGVVSSAFPDRCPPSHPYKLPQLDLRVVYPITNGTGYRLADGTEIPHADFWNTWQQATLEDLVERCLRAGINCGGISD